MFTGIIESTGVIRNLQKDGSNITFTISTSKSEALYIDQSVAHNGVCLTIVKIDENSYDVTAIKETLDKSNLGILTVGDTVNIERCVTADRLMDGHIVQGHVDTTAKCIDIQEEDGSWYFKFSLPSDYQSLIVDKGSICVNGVSLTVVDPTVEDFQVAIIPYTYEHTNFKHLKPGDKVNLEFDVIGKYVQRYMQMTMKK